MSRIITLSDVVRAVRFTSPPSKHDLHMCEEAMTHMRRCNGILHCDRCGDPVGLHEWVTNSGRCDDCYC